ncbi:methylated-DNA--[protein]-cysteine S-methyltransferase [Microbacterium pseudoresistens]|uniref:Methylated-DNA-[protein]-cysteine S-methyltransferase n=1 Tax=Microbacterium pseudoresistens TaxID=640634 RepID=A0A7Y9ET19_9MICO|nr:methylated-DNA--[protein]-cysteine S-methyltransferase [Microbacterium pseudoresistens]NYD53432.1 methylated-DNA-[protein]-cysteine S-methyltransferase [Microbacterium pseudoresistens]
MTAAIPSATIQTVDTPDGAFSILADDDGRVLVAGWTADPDAVLARLAPAHRPAHVRAVDAASPAAEAVAAYYAGELSAIDTVPVRQFGTALQRRGWAALREIAPGSPFTYTAFAAALGNDRAVRAAASICARNAPALFVPCHRVLRSDGSLGGFAWGVDVKERLLAREAAQG